MKFFNDNLKLKSESFLLIYNNLINLKKEIMDIMIPRLQFNMKFIKDDKIYKLQNFIGKNIFIKESNDTKKFLFRLPFMIKDDLFDKISEDFKENIKLLPDYEIDYKYFSKIVSLDNDKYITVDLKKKFERCKVLIEYNGITHFINPVGINLSGLNFSNDLKSNEEFNSGFWIEGTGVKIFLNTNIKSDIKVKILYQELKPKK